MPAYVRNTLAEFLESDAVGLLGALNGGYAQDGYTAQYSKQVQVWETTIVGLKESLLELAKRRLDVRDWTIILEFPLYRLRRRIDCVVLTKSAIVVIECKAKSARFTSSDRRQVEEYALDLRDFHKESRGRPIYPVLWNPADKGSDDYQYVFAPNTLSQVHPTVELNRNQLTAFLVQLPASSSIPAIIGESWDKSAYRPVPTVIEAAKAIFSGHSVRDIANADADNFRVTAQSIRFLIAEARMLQQKYLLLVTGNPGSGKTLVGLDVVHADLEPNAQDHGDLVYLSGNSSLITVLREALARDRLRQQRTAGERLDAKTVRN
jgi:hypothetical protein